MNETTSQRTARLLSMSNAQLIMHAQDLTQQRDELLADVKRCYKMLLSEPDTKGALFKAENILREAIANVKGGAA